MTYNSPPDLQSLTLYINSSDKSKLREGLENWLELGLIDHEQVKHICRNYLSSKIPEPVQSFNAFAPEIEPSPSPTISQTSPNIVFTPVNKFQRLISHLWTSFREELSVRWLLFLGLFLVIISSGVLAATQWNTFPNIGQYLVLFAYTIGFLGVSIWANKQENLQLTSKTLENVALLLIPINFWAIDGFNLWNSVINWVIIAIASLSLSYLYYYYRHSSQSFWILTIFLGLCYLQWGWSIKNLPLIFIYSASIATTIILTVLRIPKILPNTHRYQRDTAKGFVLYGLAILLIRAIFIVHLSLSDLGVAIGVMGWLFQCHNPRLKPYVRESSLTSLLEGLGAILLFLGWLSVVFQSFPWQACIITLLALYFFVERLQRQGLKRDLFTLFIVGFQGCFLLWRLISVENQAEIFNFAINLSNFSNSPHSVYSILFFPYIWGWVKVTERYYRQSQTKLAHFSEQLTLLGGIILITVGFVNPLWRSLVLLLSSVTLIYSLRFHPATLRLTYLSHLLGLSGVISLIYWVFPDLSLSQCSGILLTLMVIEWGISILRTYLQNSPIKQAFYQSCWYFGFILAILSYCLLLISLEPVFFDGNRNFQGLLWGVTPVTLTGVAALAKGRHKSRKAAFLSSYSLIIAQSLTLWHPDTRLIGLSIAVILMIVNCRYLRHPIAAILQLGFTVAGLNSGYLQYFSNKLSDIVLFNSILVCLLWLSYFYFRHSHHFWGKIYSKATDKWGVGLTSIIVVSLTVIQFSGIKANINYFLTILILITAITYRYFQKPENLTVYTLAWLIELGILQGVELENGSSLTVAMINIMIALLSLVGIHQLFSVYPRFTALYSLRILPLLFGVMGIFWRMGEFNQYTGLLSIGCAITGLGVSNFVQSRKLLSYLSLLLLSLGIYEIAIYQLLQTQENITQQFLYLVLVSVIIAVSYQVILWWGNKQEKNNIAYLSLTEIEMIAHFHWGVASLLKLLCIGLILDNPVKINPLILIASLSLAAYGILQGKSVNNYDNLWIDLGCSDIVLTTLLARLIWTNLSLFDPYWALITSIITLFLYFLPWNNWGWHKKAWQNVALFLPIFIILISYQAIANLSLLMVAAYYFYMAIHRQSIRWSYLTLILLDWLIFKSLYNNDVKELLVYVSLVGLSLIYIAQVDPILQQSNYAKERHYLRLTGSGIIGVTALLFHQTTGLIPASLGLLGIFTGLGLQIRAFLFVGTITFILTIVYQLLILSFKYAFLKWVLGLMLGIVLIAVAANFEQRRGQVISLWQSWQNRWDNWQ